MPKRYTITAIVVLIAAFIGFYVYQGTMDGSDRESRSQLLSQKVVGGHIVTEAKIDKYVISGITTDAGENGMAVFKPKGGGKYDLEKNYLTRGKLVIYNVKIDQKSYDLFWYTGNEAVSAEVSYTVNGKKQTQTFDAAGSPIIYSETPAGSTWVEAVYYDEAGNVCD